MRKLSILCGIIVVLCLLTGPALAVTYKTDVLETGNPGGWPGISKTFDDEFTVTVTPGTTFDVDIWINDAPDYAVAGGFWVDFQDYTALIALTEIEIYNNPLGPWDVDSGYVGIGPTTGMPDGAAVSMTLGLGGAFPDLEDDIIIARCSFECLGWGIADITIRIIDPEEKEVQTWAAEPPWSEDTIVTHTLKIYLNSGDTDSDGLTDDLDNCPDTPNGPDGGTCIKGTLGASCGKHSDCHLPCGEVYPNCQTCGFCSMDQENTDKENTPPGDELGDVCDDDDDNDGYPDVSDDCPLDYDQGQDGDSDGVDDVCDNCINDANSNQGDWDCDGAGDVCEDSDGDGILDGGLDHTCTEVALEGIACEEVGTLVCHDNCPGTPNGPCKGTCTQGVPEKKGDPCDYSVDCGFDGICLKTHIDTIPTGGNGCGDICECEGDFDGDGDVKDEDISLFKDDMGRWAMVDPCSICITGSSIPYPDTNACQTDADCGVSGECGPDPLNPCYGDFDCDGDVKDEDISLFKSDMGRFPGYRPCPPCSGVTCSY